MTNLHEKKHKLVNYRIITSNSHLISYVTRKIFFFFGAKCSNFCLHFLNNQEQGYIFVVHYVAQLRRTFDINLFESQNIL